MRDSRFRNSECPMTRTVGEIGNKWKPIIVRVIDTRTVRFGQLAAIIPLITRKVLAEQLKEMVEDGILIRNSIKEKPPRVDYSLSEKGQALLPLLRGLAEWYVSFENKSDKKSK